MPGGGNTTTSTSTTTTHPSASERERDDNGGSNYRVIHFIGRGSCGQCKLAEDLRVPRLVVIKEISLTTSIPSSQLRSGEINPTAKLKAALNEVNLLQAVKHPNVIAYYESWLEETQNAAVLHMPGWNATPSSTAKSNCRTVVFEQTVSIVMEFAAGGELNAEIVRRRQGFAQQQVPQGQVDLSGFDFVRDTPRYAEKVFKNRRGPFATVDVWLIFIQILSALKYVHSNRILHRDIKSRNIFITGEGVIKLGDFGIARQLKDDMAKTLVGSPFFMAPEIHRQQPYDERSDLWSLGCVLFQICTFTIAFKGESLDAIHREILAYDADVPKAHAGWRQLLKQNYPDPADSEQIEAFLEVIGQLLSVNPANRPSVTQLLVLPVVLKGYQLVVENFSESLYPQFTHIHQYWKTSISRKVQHLERLKRATSEIESPHTYSARGKSGFQVLKRSGSSSNLARLTLETISDDDQVIVRRRKKATVTTKVVKTIRRRPMSEENETEGVVRVVTVERTERNGDGGSKKSCVVSIESPFEEEPLELRVRKSRRTLFQQAKEAREHERAIFETQLLTALKLIGGMAPEFGASQKHTEKEESYTRGTTASSIEHHDLQESLDLCSFTGTIEITPPLPTQVVPEMNAGRARLPSSPARPPVGPGKDSKKLELSPAHQRAVSHAFALHGSLIDPRASPSYQQRMAQSPKLISRKSIGAFATRMSRDDASSTDSAEIDMTLSGPPRKTSISADSTAESRRLVGKQSPSSLLSKRAPDFQFRRFESEVRRADAPRTVEPPSNSESARRSVEVWDRLSTPHEWTRNRPEISADGTADLRSRLGPTRVSLTNSRLSKIRRVPREEPDGSNSSSGSVTLRPPVGNEFRQRMSTSAVMTSSARVSPRVARMALPSRAPPEAIRPPRSAVPSTSKRTRSLSPPPAWTSETTKASARAGGSRTVTDTARHARTVSSSVTRPSPRRDSPQVEGFGSPPPPVWW